MGRWFLYIAIAAMVFFAGVSIFPSIHQTLLGYSLAGYSPLLTAFVRFLPYAILLFVLYASYIAFRGGGSSR